MRAFTPTYYLFSSVVTLLLSPFLSFLFPVLHFFGITFNTPLTLYTPAVYRSDALPSHRGSVFPGVFGCCFQQEGTHFPIYARPI